MSEQQEQQQSLSDSSSTNGNTIMDDNENNAAAMNGDIVEPIYENSNDDGSSSSSSSSDPLLTGYACQQVVTQNTVQDLLVTFYMDIMSPTNAQAIAVQHIQQQLVPAIAKRYQLSNGVRCLELPVDNDTWMVQFELSPTKDFTIIDLFDGCRELNSAMIDPSIQDCNFYQVTLRGSYIGAANTQFNDIIDFLERTVNTKSLMEGLNNATDTDSSPLLYQTAFLGVPQSIPPGSEGQFTGNTDEGRENLNDPVNIEEQQTQPPGSGNRTTITIVGGLLVAAFGIAFVGIAYVLWRRRQYYVQSQRHLHNPWQLDGTTTPYDDENGGAGMDKLSVMADGVNGNDVDGRDLEPYNTSNTDLEEDFDDVVVGVVGGGGVDGQHTMTSKDPQGSGGGGVATAAGAPDVSRDGSVYLPDESSPDDNNGNNKDKNNNTSMKSGGDGDENDDNNIASPVHKGRMTFDLGNSLKNQLFGLHGKKDNINNNNQNNSGKRGIDNGNSLASHMMMGGSATPSMDGDSDADSWAQTDGTIGSLELQLEPITAEV